ncbi:response regulator [Kallotenue papyrolyticum]|uniref:response regulator n=1 Tax=Kallotenue papyrolyticum TaxID=1325125 RepID=UPI00046EBF86|nr:response regulator [Kallotenue papyrolyticum]
MNAPPRVLVVEDDGALLLLFEEVIREVGAEAILCSTAPTLDEVRALAPAVVLLDLRLGATLDGWTLFQALRGDPALARLPTIVCTGLTQVLQQQAPLFAAPEVSVLPKPFLMDDLLRVLRQALVV